MIKICKKCNISKELSEFHKQSLGMFGVRSTCKVCRSLEQNKETKSIRDRKRYQEKKEEIKQRSRDYYRNNPDLCNQRMVAYCKNRRQVDVEFRLRSSLRSRLWHAINRKQKAGSFVRDLGCTIQELKQYTESKFQDGMTWDNWGYCGWHIDHIIPLSNFDLTDREQFLKACHFTNLQPLWAEENMKKSDIIPEQYMEVI